MTDEMLRMMQLAQQGFHCSQILLFMGLEAQGKTNPDLIRSMSGLAGGIGFSGDVCGALTGAACLLALYTGRGKPDEEEDAMLIVMVAALVDWFTKEYGKAYGGIRCETILADDLRNKSARCPALVLRTYEKAKALLLENGYDPAVGRP
ncbi:MAG TPA: C-GCAxxG-C-C family protein [Thermodesulfobacteriota bacterium]|nr:C_GCAxxG_C_C family protein [Deltaproteobacteria bacterium]HNR14231.1 C-GCAxxG-C-C family protein [Thermodesulfobacteriota bacterium]HNU70218.1 C-GCAxxG-C-C family protein [Thermodesulfobacteriota bacterium]HQO76890.1 C-GCAxxG-C-C family protein [Thermodesulfobacteriota bacterium]